MTVHTQQGALTKTVVLRTIFSLLLVLVAMTSSAQSVERISLSTTRIELLKSGRPVSIGTGFFYLRADDPDRVILFLVTNHHVLTGFAPGESKAPLGDEIRFWCHRTVDAPDDVVESRVKLYVRGTQPKWLSSRSAPDADIAVLPLPSEVASDCKVVALSTDVNSFGSAMPRLRPSHPVTIVGYPYGFFDQHNHLPIWKTGAIATEPSKDFGGQRLFLVDASLFPGMSGSPVFAIASGSYEAEDGNVIVGRKTAFLGIFSAIRTLNESKLVEPFQAPNLRVQLQQSLELGYVWKEPLIREIVENFDPRRYQREVLSATSPRVP